MPEIWLIAVAVASPVAGIVGFALQLHRLKKVRLENEKLNLEIERLRSSSEEANRRVQVATPEEMERYGRPRVQPVPRAGAGAGEDVGEGFSAPVSAVVEYAFYFALVLFLVYLMFDIYRVLAWAWSLL